jgi:PAS domain S-box-containing protein
MYRLDGVIKAFTALVSLASAGVLWLLIPKALALPGPAQLQVANDDLQREVAEREIAEANLQERETLLSGLFEHSPDALVVVDTGGCIERVNGQMETVFGYSRGELYGKPVETLLPARFRESHVGHREEYVSDPHTRPMGAGLELYGKRKDGSEFPVDIMLSPLKRGEVDVVIAVVRDITRRKQAEKALANFAAELERSNAALQQFAYVASHDLKEPLRVVTSYLQLLERGYKDRLDAEAGDYIARSVAGSKRMQTLIDDLLAYSRVVTQPKKLQPLDSAIAVKQALANLETAIKESGAVIQTGDLPTVPADVTLLTQLFQNLIGNAVKFRGSDNVEVRVNAERRDGQWQFSVRDNGIGIDPQYNERIFGIFQRLHTRQEYPGTGIGLAICKRIVEGHGGRIWVESEPGKGATFFFTVPDGEVCAP